MRLCVPKVVTLRVPDPDGAHDQLQCLEAQLGISLPSLADGDLLDIYRNAHSLAEAEAEVYAAVDSIPGGWDAFRLRY